ncbi:Swi3-domain-containing protein [Neolentinus lepideus HHB14362 ss-1]|uniref:Chromosome segregation in meiosis protein n=1 Tax=Neolentinus lepideus HHB14362 ss-1 TaxID=1314782 RepID=A0A165TE74_9AGAM|nr:Swi3-domain-containing protein [Neolentinus lepideus HHB14362 ss-1]
MSIVALEDIWDAPVEPSTPQKSTQLFLDDDGHDAPRSLKRPLFLNSDSEEDVPKTTKGTAQASASARPDIDAMFDNIDDEEGIFPPLAPSLDMDALQRDAEQRHAKSSQSNLHAILPSSSPSKDHDTSAENTGNRSDKASKDAPKERKVLPKLDEARLLGPDGFPALIAEAKKFKPRGKGQESTDLGRVIQLYQFWTHKMYPKMQFRDTVNRVEKLCHSRRMHVALSVWRDEAKGLINGMKPDDPIDLASDSEDDDADDGQRAQVETRGSSIDDVGSRGASRVPSAGASRPPSSRSVDPATDGNDFDIDAMIREQEEMEAEQGLAPKENKPRSVDKYGSKPASEDAMDLDEEAMWDDMMMADFTGAVPSIPAVASSETTAPQSQKDDITAGSHAVDDEDMWDVVREMETEAQEAGQQDATASESGPAPSEEEIDGHGGEHSEISSPQKKQRISNADDWEDMYI